MTNPRNESFPCELFGDGMSPGGTRERILEHAQDLFYSHGFHEVGIDQIVRRAGVTKATFYNHFESRDALIVEVIQRADQQLTTRFMQEVRRRAGWDAKAGLLAMFDVLDEWFNHPDFRGCLFLNACIAFPNPHDPIHQAAGAHYLTEAREIAQMATALGIEDAAGFAEQWVLLVEGAVAYRAIAQDNRAARIVRQVAEATLARHLQTGEQA